MIDYMLKMDNAGMVRYLMEQKDCNVTGTMPIQNACDMLRNGAVNASDRHPGYPITADGTFFFDAMYREDGG